MIMNQTRPVFKMIWPMATTKIYGEEQLLTKYYGLRHLQQDIHHPQDDGYQRGLAPNTKGLQILFKKILRHYYSRRD